MVLPHLSGTCSRWACGDSPGHFRIRAGLIVAGLLVLVLTVPIFGRSDSSQLLAAAPTDQSFSADQLHQQARDFLKAGEYRLALPPVQRALELQEANLGADHPEVADIGTTLGLVYFQLAKIDLAKTTHERALNIRQEAIGSDSVEAAESLTHLGRVWMAKGEYGKSEDMFKHALTIREQAFGPQHVAVGETLMYLAMVQGLQMRLQEALATQARAVHIFDKDPQAPPSDHSMALTSYGVILIRNGEFAKGKPFIERALLVQEGSLGSSHPIVARTLDHLADVEMKMGHPEQALALAKRALKIREDRLGPEHPETSASLHTLGGLVWRQGDLNAAAGYFQRALTITEDTVGSAHPVVAANLLSLGEVHRQMGHLDTAREMFQRALKIQEMTLGPKHNDVTVTLTRLSWVAMGQKDDARALALLERAKAIRENKLGGNHPDMALLVNDLARVHHRMGKLDRARSYYDQARQIYLEVGRLNQDVDDAMASQLHKRGKASLQDYALLLAHLSQAPTHQSQDSSVVTDGFVVAEQARGYLVQAAVSKAMARLQARQSSDVELAKRIDELRRRRQVLWDTLHGLYGHSSLDAEQKERVASVKQEVLDVQRLLHEGLAQLEASFPQYADLAFPKPLGLDAIQKLLGPHEALVSFFCWDHMLQLWFVRHGHPPVSLSFGIPKTSIVKLVEQVRGSVASPKAVFDVQSAFQLYRWLLQPLEPQLSEVDNLIIIPDEALLPLPFAALITDNASPEFRYLAQQGASGQPLPHDRLKTFLRMPWLIQRFPLTVIPSASAFKLLREARSSSSADGDRFIGFGDPLFSGSGTRRGGKIPELQKGRVAYERLRMMNALPGTKHELLAIARTLDVDPTTNVFLQERATETQVRQLLASGRLGSAKILSFATHGLLSGQLSGLVEPALVLTVPDSPTPQDDGLLTMGEILEFPLPQVDWVILSACNTAGGDGSGQGLTGLARAFFFSGAKSLLVSHWSVDDQATQALMTEVFTLFGKDSSLIKSRALQQGMLAVMAQGNSEAHAYFSHPYAWAPFFLVGESG